jgi:hypothetical protein
MSLQMNSRGKHIFLGALLVACGAHGQTIVQKTQAYVDEPKLPFAPKYAPPPKQIAVAPLSAHPAFVVAPQESWDIQLKDINIAGAFHRWANKAGYRVRWDAQKHFMVEAPDTITGSFEDALKVVLESPGIAESAYPLEVCIYPNTPPLARITRKGDQEKECK